MTPTVSANLEIYDGEIFSFTHGFRILFHQPPDSTSRQTAHRSSFVVKLTTRCTCLGKGHTESLADQPSMTLHELKESTKDLGRNHSLKGTHRADFKG